MGEVEAVDELFDIHKDCATAADPPEPWHAENLSKDLHRLWRLRHPKHLRQAPRCPDRLVPGGWSLLPPRVPCPIRLHFPTARPVPGIRWQLFPFENQASPKAQRRKLRCR